MNRRDYAPEELSYHRPVRSRASGLIVNEARGTTISRMFAPDSFAVVKVRERNGADLFVILIPDLRNADRTGHSWSCSREMSAEELARELEIEGLSPEAIAELVVRAQDHFRVALGG